MSDVQDVGTRLLIGVIPECLTIAAWVGSVVDCHDLLAQHNQFSGLLVVAAKGECFI
ncbi:hypothetical protein OAE79_02235 [Rhodopirellula sp.]|nr:MULTISPECIES: hypothetical protein [Pirellulaceae]MDB4679136.1 hypothetical protein [Rhodopirellula sp.]